MVRGGAEPGLPPARRDAPFEFCSPALPPRPPPPPRSTSSSAGLEASLPRCFPPANAVPRAWPGREKKTWGGRSAERREKRSHFVRGELPVWGVVPVPPRPGADGKARPD